MENSKQPSMTESGERVAGDLDELGRAARARSGELLRSVNAFVDEHPYASMGIAFGVGYVLAGALFSRTTMRALGFGARFAAGGLVRQLVAGGGLGFLAPVLQNLATEPSTEE